MLQNQTFFHPDYTVGTVVSTVHAPMELADYHRR